MKPHIVIAGGGFAGTTLVRALQRRLPPHASLTLISEESYTTFNPMLPEAVGAALFPEQAVAPIRAMLRSSTRFVMATVTKINAAEKTLSCETLAGTRSFAYDHLVLALGSRARLDLVPGMAEHALPLKTIGDALHIRNMSAGYAICLGVAGLALRFTDWRGALAAVAVSPVVSFIASLPAVWRNPRGCSRSGATPSARSDMATEQRSVEARCGAALTAGGTGTLLGRTTPRGSTHEKV
jgi:hypothetical protein